MKGRPRRWLTRLLVGGALGLGVLVGLRDLGAQDAAPERPRLIEVVTAPELDGGAAWFNVDRPL
ncbi:MAG TPA: hypothetical protein VGW35_02600, partial [Methylomirabilota bacterium]|nr:hypothetical protein [Methylomirabilota bacterium]